MVKAKRFLILPLILAALLLIFLTGCKAPETTTPEKTIPATTTAISPFTQQELQQIVADSLLATKSAETYKLNLDITAKTVVDKDSNASGMSMNGTASFDVKLKQMMMSADMITNPGTDSAQKQPVDIYLLTDYIYIKATLPEIGEQWIKTVASEDILKSFNANMMQQEIDVMKAPASIDWVDYATVNGIDCYVVTIVPNEQYLRDYARSQLNDKIIIDWDKVKNTSDIYKELSYKIWIGKETKYVHKMQTDSVIEFSKDFAHSDTFKFDKATTDMSGSMEMYDYNAPVEITLPKEADNAIEISPDAFAGK